MTASTSMMRSLNEPDTGRELQNTRPSTGDSVPLTGHRRGAVALATETRPATGDPSIASGLNMSAPAQSRPMIKDNPIDKLPGDIFMGVVGPMIDGTRYGADEQMLAMPGIQRAEALYRFHDRLTVPINPTDQKTAFTVLARTYCHPETNTDTRTAIAKMMNEQILSPGAPDFPGRDVVDLRWRMETATSDQRRAMVRDFEGKPGIVSRFFGGNVDTMNTLGDVMMSISNREASTGASIYFTSDRDRRAMTDREHFGSTAMRSLYAAAAPYLNENAKRLFSPSSRGQSDTFHGMT